MFTLVTILKVKKNKRFILTFGCLSPALCFPALTVSTAAGKQSGDVTALLSGRCAHSQSREAERRGQTAEVALVVGTVGYQLEWFIRGKPKQSTEEQSILEKREERALQEAAGRDLTQVISLKEKLEFTPKAVLNRNREEKS
ncbi:unnamed protein product [Ranitomeya imitator]|uniref:Uncharacterized protein n=1 Tax=Ranitomeya imitator TaxID=111125 RepID=A0ABN9L1X8_9NEOB|nr:unnamed protein product [Ranitomeya imitator]